MRFETSRFVGSWHFTIHPESGTAPTIALGTFGADGTMIASPPAVEAFPPHPPGIVYVSAAHGGWEPANDRAAILTFMGQVSGDDSTCVGVGTLAARLELDPDGDTFQGTYDFAMADVGGNIIATDQGSLRGARIVVAAAVPVAG